MTAPQKILLLYLAFINVLAWAAFGIDKYKARHNRWRIPEGTLWLLALLGGAVGAWLGMKTFRHKTQHLRFMIGMPLMVVVNGVAFASLYRFFIR